MEISLKRQCKNGKARKSAPIKVLFNIFLGNMMQKDCFAGDAVKDAEETDIPLLSMSICRRPLCNLWFADDFDLLGGSEGLQQLTERLEKTAAG